MFYTVLLILNIVWNIKIISLAGSATELLWDFSQGSFFVQYAEIKFFSPTTRKIPFFQKSRIVNKWKIPGGIAYVEQQLIKKGFHSKSKLKNQTGSFQIVFLPAEFTAKSKGINNYPCWRCLMKKNHFKNLSLFFAPKELIICSYSRSKILLPKICGKIRKITGGVSWCQCPISPLVFCTKLEENVTGPHVIKIL